MLCPRRWIAISCLLLFSFAARASEPEWIEVRSEHFSVITDAGEKNGHHVTDLFEQMRAAFGVLFVRTKINQPIPLQIIAFRNTKEIRQYSPLFKGKPIEVAGYFQPGEDKNFIMVDISQEDNWETVFHEYAHLLLSGNFPETAPWFDEGFAEYLSTMKVANGTVEIGNVIPGAELLNEANKFRLRDLFQVQHHSETYNQSGQARDMFYVESWLVVHYLFDTNRLSQAAKYFILTNQQKMPIPEAVQGAFGMSLPEMEKTIWTNWRTGKLYAKRFKEKIPTTFPATVRPLDSLEARAQLADLDAHSIDYGQRAIQQFEDILRQNPNQPMAQRGLGYAYLRNRDFQKALPHFQAAAKIGSSDPRVYYYSAVLMQQTQPSAMSSPEFAENLRKAIELDPQYADAYHLLGLAQMQKRENAEAEQNLRHAVELSPRNEFYRLNLAAVLMNEQKTDESTAMLQALVNGSNPMVAEQARNFLSYASMASRKPETTNTMTVIEGPAEPAKAETADSEPPVQLHDADKRPMAYLKGKIVGVDCSAEPAAIITIVSSEKTYHLHTANRDKLVLINADRFSCDWKDVKASANYRDSGNLQGDLVTLELP
jgi:tetratricopeptide (TPR) repeat protein